jgi:hypothetical protein
LTQSLHFAVSIAACIAASIAASIAVLQTQITPAIRLLD